MRHLIDHRKLGRTTPHRQAMLKNMVVSLIRHERIQTTLPKAKELRRLADRVVTWGKRGTLASRRQARRFVSDKEALSKLFNDLAPRFANRNGGYTRILRTAYRTGDQAPLALIEYLDRPEVKPRPSPSKKGRGEVAKEGGAVKEKGVKSKKAVGKSTKS